MLRVGDFIDAHRNRQRCSDSCFVTTKVAYSDTHYDYDNDVDQLLGNLYWQ